MTKKVDDNNFNQEVVEESKSKPVLVDFYADWCGPCRMQSPIIDLVSEELKDKATICKLDTEESQLVASQFGIMSIPTLLLFKDGKEVERFVGVQPKDILINSIEKYI